MTKNESNEPAAPAEVGGLVRLRLTLAYDGTDFAGWALQPDQRTVAGVFRVALSRLFGEFSGLAVAGRTDTGVHALGQVCHVDVPMDRWDGVADRALRRFAGVLPPDVRVRAVEPVSSDFDARFSALRRHYRYRITDAAGGALPLVRFDTIAWSRPLDASAMAAAADRLLGLHNFAAFCRRREGATTIRELQQLSVSRAADLVTVDVAADAFCHSMVRSLVGALLAVGDSRKPLDWPVALLSRTDRSSEVVVAPPHGLTLIAVDYPAPSEWATRTEATRRPRA